MTYPYKEKFYESHKKEYYDDSDYYAKKTAAEESYYTQLFGSFPKKETSRRNDLGQRFL